jgi:hypothetical protein
MDFITTIILTNVLYGKMSRIKMKKYGRKKGTDRGRRK